MRHSLVILFLLPFAAQAQGPVAPVTNWLASVDSATQKIVLSWSPSIDTAGQGYDICIGDTSDGETFCRGSVTVNGRLDTSHFFDDHSPLSRHQYRVRAFESPSRNSYMTPFFNNIVLQADIADCAKNVSVAWTPYLGMPTGVDNYRLMVREEPTSNEYQPYHSTDSIGPLAYNFEMLPTTTHVSLYVEAVSTDGLLTSWSNIVNVTRRTVDTATRLNISNVNYDNEDIRILLTLDLDNGYTAAPYRLWRSIDDAGWSELAVLQHTDTAYIDYDINPYRDSYCYRLTVSDACGMNERQSAESCIAVPDPPEPGVALPNALIAGDDGPNGEFRPHLRGFKSDLYELTVYDRHGLQVFSSTDPATPWRPDVGIPQGAYSYILRIRFVNNKIHTYTGTITVIR